IEHGAMLDDEAIDMMLEAGTYLVPTLFVVEDIFSRGAETGLSEVSLVKARRLAELHSKSFSRAAAAGIKIALGTDIINEENHGRSAFELELMVRHGFSPMQAIVAATRTSAEVCRIADQVGTLEAGKLADLLVVDGDPLADITVLQESSKMLLVMKEGNDIVNRL
ncbi:MAG: amidohydrolase family protein, partial [Deltaproteobacteria bacterium]|nr:amidohydrolase family protein [Deltaproteobacteria bacterium]